MITRHPLMTPAAWLVVAITGLVLTGIVVVSHKSSNSAFDLTKRSSKTASTGGVEVTTILALQQKGGSTHVLATVSVVNTGDQAVAYDGSACYAPARVKFVSNRPAPAGPQYSASAAALRQHVMDYRRTLDQSLSFSLDSATQKGSVPGCDEMGPPVLPPHQLIVYTENSPLGVTNQPFVDTATTEVVTTLRLGKWSSDHVFEPSQTVEVRSPLSAIATAVMASAADYTTTAKRFDLLMTDPTIAGWVDPQDPSLWRGARLQDSFHNDGRWKLTAFNRKWAEPLLATVSSSAVAEKHIPVEPAAQPVVTAAAVPPDAQSHATTFVPARDLYVGDLVLPSGKVLVGDTVSSDSMLTFDYRLNPGSYPIHVVTARGRYDSGHFELVAWIELVMSQTPVTHWQAAIPVGHSANELKAGDVFTFGTDGAEGGFASPEAMKFMDASLITPDQSLYTSLGEREEANEWLWGTLTVDSRTNANVFASDTGSDGGFPVLLGLDANEHPAALLSDFNGLEMTYSGIHAK